MTTQAAAAPDPVERKLRNDVAAGDPSDFRGWKATPGRGEERPIVQASLIKELVMDAAAPSGVQISYVTIVGILDLAYARRSDGSECNALLLKDCALVGAHQSFSGPAGIPPASGRGHGDEGTLALDARHSRLGLISLKNCRVDGIDLSSAVISGDLIIDGLRPLARRRSCWVRARGLRVGGAVTVSGARLRLPEKLPGYWAGEWADKPDPYALDLAGARITGALIVRNRFVAHGGVNLARTTVGGGLFMLGGTHITAADLGDRPGRVALRAAFAQLQGQVFLTGGRRAAKRFCAKGELDFYGCHVGGSLALQGVHLTRADPEQPLYASIDLTSATVSSRLILGAAYDYDTPPFAAVDPRIPFEAVDEVILNGALIGGDLEIDGTPAAPINSVAATALKVHGNLQLSGELAATCDFSGSVIDGDLELGGEDSPFVLDTTRASNLPRLKLVGATVSGALTVAPRVALLPRVTAEPYVRSTELLSYPGWRLAEACALTDDGSNVAILAFLYRPYCKSTEFRGRKVSIVYRPHRNNIVILNGESSQFHGFNERNPPVLKREAQVREYLSLFCNYVWGDNGAFRIVGAAVRAVPVARDDPIVNAAASVLDRAPKDGSWHAIAEVEYASARFHAAFLIEPSGEVSMIDDEHIGSGLDRRVVRYDAPMRWLSTVSPEPSDLYDLEWLMAPPLWFVFASGSDGLRWEDVQRELLRGREKQFGPRLEERPEIDLRGLKAGLLTDGEGENWGLGEDKWPYAGPKLLLRLSGFEYGRIDAPMSSDTHAERDSMRSQAAPLGQEFDDALLPSGAARGSRLVVTPRKKLGYRRYWLNAQYKRYPPYEIDYRPQPYEQLARVWRRAGHLENADDISIDKLELEKRRLSKPGLSLRENIKHRTLQLLAHLVQFLFGFGLKKGRATRTLVAFWAVGVFMFWGLSSAEVLKIDTSAVATAVSTTVSGDERVVVEEARAGANDEEIPCGDHINELVYPLDVMIPLLDLHQESRCDVSITNLGWGALKGLYAIVGWLIISGFIITWSGVVRRHTER
jgi:hypothetical protein